MTASDPPKADREAGPSQRPWLPAAVYAGVSLIVLWGLLLPGYVLTLDMVLGPRLALADWFYGLQTDIWGELPLYGLMALLNLLIPMWLVQKLVLFAILFLAGFSAHHLSPARSPVGKYLAGLLFMLNPFVYARFLGGQWHLLLGYAVLPLAVKAAISLAQEPAIRRAVAAAWLLALVGVFSPHMVALALTVSFVILLWSALKLRHDHMFFPLLRHSLLFVGLFLLLSLYWLVPAVIHKATALSAIGPQDLEVFAARPMKPGGSIFLAVSSLHGFWRTGFTYMDSLTPLWFLPYLFFLFLAVHGFISRQGDPRLGIYVRALALAGLLALLLGTGVSSFMAMPYRFLFVLKGAISGEIFTGPLLYYRRVYRDFAQYIKGEKPDFPGVETGLQTLRVMDAVAESIFTGSAVHLERRQASSEE